MIYFRPHKIIQMQVNMLYMDFMGMYISLIKIQST